MYLDLYHNYTSDELARMARDQNNELAMAINESLRFDHGFDAMDYEDLIDDAVDYFVDKVDVALKAYIESRYQDPDSDYVGDVEHCVQESYTLDNWFDHVLKEVEFWERPLGMIEEAEAFYVELAKSRDPEVIERLTEKLDAEWTAATDVTHHSGYFDHDSASIGSFPTGEVEEEVKSWMDGCEVPESYHDLVLKRLDQATWNEGSDYLYIDLSDEHFSWALNLEWLEEFYQQEMEAREEAA